MIAVWCQPAVAGGCRGKDRATIRIKGEALMKKFLFGASALVLSAAFSGAAFADYTLTILHTNDLHSRIELINKYDFDLRRGR